MKKNVAYNTLKYLMYVWCNILYVYICYVRLISEISVVTSKLSELKEAGAGILLEL